MIAVADLESRWDGWTLTPGLQASLARQPRFVMHFGVKANVGVDAQSGLVHTAVGTVANVNDVTQAGALLHGEETAAFGDAGYRGMDKREDAHDPKWRTAMQPGMHRLLDLKRRGRAFSSGPSS